MKKYMDFLDLNKFKKNILYWIQRFHKSDQNDNLPGNPYVIF